MLPSRSWSIIPTQEKKGVEVVPIYRIKSKSAVSEAEPPKWVERHFDGITDSFQGYMKNEVVRDFQASVARVSEVPYHEETLASLPTTAFEFPNGYNDSFGIERYRAAEMLFNPALFGNIAAAAAAPPIPAAGAAAEGEAQLELVEDSGAMGVGDLVTSCLDECDIDIQSVRPPFLRLSRDPIGHRRDGVLRVLTSALPRVWVLHWTEH